MKLVSVSEDALLEPFLRSCLYINKTHIDKIRENTANCPILTDTNDNRKSLFAFLDSGEYKSRQSGSVHDGNGYKMSTLQT